MLHTLLHKSLFHHHKKSPKYVPAEPHPHDGQTEEHVPPGGGRHHGGGLGRQEDRQDLQGGGAPVWGGLGQELQLRQSQEGLFPENKSLLFKLLHQLLPTGERVN